ncbi:MAG: hypothetical protein EB830_05785 [Nitrosopumilus sp. H13]|nr:MAG: hypothetical protein EB830_05785 [Nitrosopumilus sp. H13]
MREVIIPGSNHTPALAFVVIRDRIEMIVTAWLHLEGFTYNPKPDLIFDVNNLHEALALFLDLVRGNRHFQADLPIYLVAVTHHASTKVDDVLRDGYETISRSSNQPLIGYWKNFEGESYLDAVAATQFINKDAAIRVGKKYGQEFILAVKPDGRHEYIQTHQEHVRP